MQATLARLNVSFDLLESSLGEFEETVKADVETSINLGVLREPYIVLGWQSSRCLEAECGTAGNLLAGKVRF
jgi:hypothetical protein